MTSGQQTEQPTQPEKESDGQLVAARLEDIATGMRALSISFESTSSQNIHYLSKYGDNLAAGIAAIGATVTTLVVDTTPDTLNGHVTFPTTLYLAWQPGCVVDLGDYNLIVNGGLTAQGYQLFNKSGTGNVSFGALAVIHAHPEWWGAVGDSDGLADDGTGNHGTDDYAAIQAALDASRIVELLAKNYRTSTLLTISNPNQDIYGAGASWAGYKTAIVPDAALDTFVITSAVTKSGASIHDFAILGNLTTNALGGIYLEDDGSSGNFGNSVYNMYIKGFAKTGAYGIWDEAWGTGLYNLYLHSIKRGTALRFGAGGVTGTTQYFERVYVTESDIGMRFNSTNIGATGINCIFEANTVEILVEAMSITLVNPYFEHVNAENDDHAGSRQSISVPTIEGDDVDAAISVMSAAPLTGVDAALTIQHMNLVSLDDAASTFIRVSSNATLIIEGGDWNDRITDPAQIVIGGSLSSTLIIKDWEYLDTSLLPQVSNKGWDRIWSNKRLQTTLPGSDAVSVVGDTSTTGVVLADFGLDITTLYTFKVFGTVGNKIVSVHELYVDFFNGVTYNIEQHTNWDDTGTYPATFTLTSTGSGKTDITVLNGHAATTIVYKIMFLGSTVSD